MDPYYIEDCMQWNIPHTSWKLQGYSVAGKRTGFMIKSLNILLDAGVNCRKTPKNILVTHSHSDHSFYLPCIAMDRHSKLVDKPVVYCPKEMVEPLQLMARASQSLNDCRPLYPDNQIVCNGIVGDDSFCINIKKRHIKITVCTCSHTVPTVGYIISEEQKKLKNKYKHLSGKEISKLIKNGITVTDSVDCMKIAFLGDTTIDVFKINPRILQCPVIIIECTAFDSKIPEKTAYSRGHIHWTQLKPLINKHTTIHFVLIHFSSRYKTDEIVKFFAAQNCANVTVWVGKQYFNFS